MRALRCLTRGRGQAINDWHKMAAEALGQMGEQGVSAWDDENRWYARD